MVWRVLIVIVLVLTTAGCRGRSQETAAPAPQPQTTGPAAPVPTTPEPVGVAPTAPEAGLTFPGARQTHSSSFSGTDPTGNPGQWSTVILETSDSFDKVRDFYKANPPKGFTQSFSADQTEEGGRNFVLWFTRADGKAWHTISAQEEKASGKVTIALATGSAP